MADTIMTLKQYTDAEDRATAKYFNVTIAEVRQETPRRRREIEWREYVIKAFDQGGTITTRLWRAMDESLQRRILRRPRALRDDALTRDLLSKKETP